MFQNCGEDILFCVNPLFDHWLQPYYSAEGENKGDCIPVLWSLPSPTVRFITKIPPSRIWLYPKSTFQSKPVVCGFIRLDSFSCFLIDQWMLEFKPPLPRHH